MKHAAALKTAWRDETKRRRARRQRRIETAFLPAAIEIMDTPPRPIGRGILWVIVAASAFALVWAGLSQIDIVAVAEGRVIPRGKLQSVEAAETGIVRALLVREGDRVAKGDPLIELDPTDADADAEAARGELAAARLQRARARALLQYSDGEPWELDPDGLAPGVSAAESSLVIARVQSHEAELESLRERLSAALISHRQTETEVERINATLPLVEEQLAARRELAEAGYAPRIQVTELQERATTLAFELRVQSAELDKTARQAQMIRQDIAGAQQKFRADAAAELSEAESIISTRGELLAKAERREALQTLNAPVDGIINEISVNTIGEVIEPGAPLVTIVPQGVELIIESFLLNKDVGFVRPGQQAVVKLEAYPFMRYGYLVGEVEHVSPDSVVDETRGLVFPSRVRIVGSEMRIAHEEAKSSAKDKPFADTATPTVLAPGLSVAVEIKTGRRSVLSYLLSPIAKSVSEAGRER